MTTPTHCLRCTPDGAAVRLCSLHASVGALVAALEASKRSHLVVEGDCWYSCPKSGEGCNDEAKDVCLCGADIHNARLEAAIRATQWEDPA